MQQVPRTWDRKEPRCDLVEKALEGQHQAEQRQGVHRGWSHPEEIEYLSERVRNFPSSLHHHRPPVWEGWYKEQCSADED